MTQKLLEAEKKKLTQLELQLDEDTAKGISSVEKVRLMMLLIQCLVLWLCNFDFEVVVVSCMDDKQTCNLHINIGGMAFAFSFFLFLEGGGGGQEKGVQPFILHIQVQTKKKRKLWC